MYDYEEYSKLPGQVSLVLGLIFAVGCYFGLHYYIFYFWLSGNEGFGGIFLKYILFLWIPAYLFAGMCRGIAYTHKGWYKYKYFYNYIPKNRD